MSHGHKVGGGNCNVWLGWNQTCVDTCTCDGILQTLVDTSTCDVILQTLVDTCTCDGIFQTLLDTSTCDGILQTLVDTSTCDVILQTLVDTCTCDGILQTLVDTSPTCDVTIQTSNTYAITHSKHEIRMTLLSKQQVLVMLCRKRHCPWLTSGCI